MRLTTAKNLRRTSLLTIFSLSVLLVSIVSAGCDDGPSEPAKPPPGRFAAVTKQSQQSEKAQRSFCEATYPKDGAGTKPFVTPAERPVPGKTQVARKDAKWRWVNLWATWCKPCVEELPLLDKWKRSLDSDGIPIEVELWSIDEDEGALKSWLASKPMPGPVKWLKDQESLGPALESFGIDKNSAIPVHLFVDAGDNIRCVRVGAVHGGDFGAIKTIFAGG